MKSLKIFLLAGLGSALVLCANMEPNFISAQIDPGGMKYVCSVDERFQSYNIEMAEVTGGNYWKPYDQLSTKSGASAAELTRFEIGDKNNGMFQAIAPVNLYESRLRKLASALGPAYLRVSGTWANSVFFQDNDEAALNKPPKGFKGVLTRSQWKGVLDFSKAVNAKLITSFAISAGVRDEAGIWTPVEAQKVADFTKSSGGTIAAAELFNEPTIASAGNAPEGYNAETFAKDIAVFRTFTKAALPGMMVVGPGSTGEVIQVIPKSMTKLKSEDLLSAKPAPRFDIFSYHSYGGVSQRGAAFGKDLVVTTDDALSVKWFSKSDAILQFYKRLRDQYAPGKPIWVTETADAACGGNPWAATYLDCFRYLDQMGRLAKGGVSVICHNTLASGEYGLLDPKTHFPRPNYWAALLWSKLMGTDVYDAGKGAAGIDIFVHSMKGNDRGITLLFINTNRIRANIKIPKDAQQYTLTSTELQGKTVQLNGVDLNLNASDELPSIMGKPIKAGINTLPPLSITFITIPDVVDKK